MRRANQLNTKKRRNEEDRHVYFFVPSFPPVHIFYLGERDVLGDMIGAVTIQLVSDFFRISNYAEAGLWFAIAAAVLFRFGKTRLAVIAAIALVFFGISDIVETTTGAWWRPWWLFVWKAVCVVTLLGVFWTGRKKRAD